MPPSPQIYDAIGRNYRANRAADPRIVEALVELMGVPPGSTICDVGAGAGNYANAMAARGYSVLALEPSQTMRAQADAAAGVRWIEGVAEAMPLPDACADASMCVLAVHHFADFAGAVHEMGRVSRGAFVFLTYDPRESEPVWFEEYFPEIIAAGFPLFPPLADFIADVERATGRRGEARAFPLPNDLTDRFMMAKWNAPEAYFDASLRANNSGFAKADPAAVERGLTKLRADLASGAWDERYLEMRTRESFDAGYRFLAFRR